MENNRLELELLPSYGLFALVVKHRSFAEAARQAGLARSAVSQRIARLEKHVGAGLLRRTTRRVTPTEPGLRLFERCLPLLAEAEALGAGLHDDASRPLGVNAPASLMHACLGALLDEHLSATPDVSLELTLENRSVDLLETRDEVVVRVSREVPKELVARRVAQTRSLVVASPGYLSRAGRPETPDQLMHHACLRYSVSSAAAEWRFGRTGRTFSVPVRGPLAATDGLVLERFCLAGRGLAVLPEFMVAPAVARGALVPVLEAWERPPFGVWLILPGGRRASPRARALVSFLGRRLPSALPALER
ncbi:MAG: LysR family transcriptional regulator [Myxococcaceae bacterium]|nr:LysR family transcriptional regulator [Myxococcaceae bacterium]